MSDFITGLAIFTWALSPAIFLICALISCAWNWTIGFINDEACPHFEAHWPQEVVEFCESSEIMKVLSATTVFACLVWVLLVVPFFLLEFDGGLYDYLTATGGMFSWVAYPVSIAFVYLVFIFSARAIVRLVKAVKELKNKLHNHINDPNGHK